MALKSAKFLHAVIYTGLSEVVQNLFMLQKHYRLAARYGDNECILMQMQIGRIFSIRGLTVGQNNLNFETGVHEQLRKCCPNYHTTVILRKITIFCIHCGRLGMCTVVLLTATTASVSH